MTNTKMLENVYVMLEEAIDIMQPESEEQANNIKNLLLNHDFCFGRTIAALKSDIQAETSKKTGRSAQLSAAKRMIKEAKKNMSHRPGFHGAWIGEDEKQYINSGYYAVRFNQPMELTKSEGDEGATERIINNAYDGLELKLPEESTVKTMIIKHNAKCSHIKPKDRPTCEFDFGENLPVVNAQWLLNTLQALPEAAAKYTTLTAPIFFSSPDGEAVLCPIRK